MDRYRRGLLAAVLCMAAAVFVRASWGQDPAPPDSDAARAVLGVLDTAAEESREAALRALADELDPWIAVDQLAHLGKIDAARSLASALRAPAHVGLTAYLEGRVDAPAEPEARQTLTAALSKENPEEVRRRLRSASSVREPLLRARLLLLHGSAEYAARDLESSTRAFRSAAEIAGKIGWLAGQSLALYRCASAQRAASDLTGSLASLEEMLSIDQACGETASVAQAHGLIGATRLMLGDYRAAERSLESALDEYQRAERPDKCAGILHNLVVLHQKRGAHRAVIATAKRAIAAYEELGATSSARSARLMAAGAMQVLGDTRQSLAIQEEVLRDARADGPGGAADVARALKGSAQSLFQEGRTEDGLKRLRSAVAAFQELGDERSRCASLATLAYYLSETGAHDSALETATEAVAVARALRDPWLEANALQNLADAQHDTGAVDGALESLSAADALARELDSDKLLADGARRAARFALAARRFDDVLRHCKEAAAADGRILAGAPGELGVTARERYAWTFDAWAQAAVAAKDPVEAWTALETGRAGAFLEAIENRDAVRAAAVPAKLEQALVDAQRAEAAAATQLQRGRNEDSGLPLKVLRKLGADLRAAREARAQATEAIRREAGVTAEWLFPQPADLAAVRAALRPREALVLYGTAGDRQIAVVVTAAGPRLVDLGSVEACTAACERFDATSEDAADTTTLRALLATPLGLGAPVERVLVSPAGALFSAPFGVLFPEREVVHVPSASVHLKLHASAAHAGKGVLAVGSPDYTGTPHAPLPGTRDEARTAGGKATPRVVLLDKEATETGFRTALRKSPRWGVVHLAAHGLSDTDRPMSSGLALTASTDDDGLLTASEVYLTPVPADLVVLSACESGRGRVYRGEGLQGLTRAFLFAGAPRVVCSLWKVDDAATAALMEHFYAALDAGKTPAAALRLAQSRIRAEPKWAHPRYWGAWMLWGVGD